ncbi:protein of unassigned function [Methylobacterium oryzae CBMB20]|uniref:Protein of unassigned function n=1 Tax=Methylobacterium oryzae CBMB20 TaxID=693986 RepID=A0A089NYV1_9HYPH|nr:protein of unassigned function [Methylobacterium oryzae CBMB20]
MHSAPCTEETARTVVRRIAPKAAEDLKLARINLTMINSHFPGAGGLVRFHK